MKLDESTLPSLPSASLWLLQKVKWQGWQPSESNIARWLWLAQTLQLMTCNRHVAFLIGHEANLIWISRSWRLSHSTCWLCHMLTCLSIGYQSLCHLADLPQVRLHCHQSDGGSWTLLGTRVIKCCTIVHELTAGEPMYCSWADEFKLSWQDADAWDDKLFDSWADISQQNWHKSAELTECSWANKWQRRWQITVELATELTSGTWADTLQLSWADISQPSWNNTTELTYCSWADKWQLSWQIAAELTAELTSDSWADKVHLSWHVAIELSWHMAAQLRQSSWADTLQSSWQTAAELQDHDWADNLLLSYHTMAELTHHNQPTYLKDCRQNNKSVSSWEKTIKLTGKSSSGQSTNEKTEIPKYMRANGVLLTAELTRCSWVDSWVDKWQLSWQRV